jgi:hypothetical protein
MPGDADDGLDEGLPAGCDQGIGDGKDLDGASSLREPPVLRIKAVPAVA